MLGTSDMLEQLAEGGFRVGEGYLRYLLRERIVKTPAQRLGRALVWQDEDLRLLKAELLRRGRGPVTARRVPA